MRLIRTIEKSDIPTLAAFEREIAQISFEDEAIVDDAFHQKKLEKAMPREQNGMLVLEIDGTIVGWLWMAVKQNYLTQAKYMVFKSLYIAEPYRGTESVKALMDAGMAFCRKEKIQKIIGKTHVKNLAMQVVYKNYGFAPTHLTMEYVVES